MKLKKKSKDLVFVLLFPIIIFISVFFLGLKINYFESLILIFTIPSLYLSLKNRNKVRKITHFSLLASLPTALIFELIGVGDKAWIVPESILSYRLFGFSPLENYIWMFICSYFIIIFYEHFYNKKFQPDISKRIKIIIGTAYPLTILIIALFLYKPSLLIIPYAYLWLCLIFWLIPMILFSLKYPKYITNFFCVSIFFFYMHIIFELIGLKLRHWTYPGLHYLGWIHILNLSFPLEEFLFVLLLGGFVTLVYYEYFTNKKLK
jgi:hypothetical protein